MLTEAMAATRKFKFLNIISRVACDFCRVNIARVIIKLELNFQNVIRRVVYDFSHNNICRVLMASLNVNIGRVIKFEFNFQNVICDFIQNNIGRVCWGIAQTGNLLKAV